MIAWLLAALVLGSLVYCCLAIRAVFDYLRQRLEPSPEMPFITVMRPLAGAEEGLRDNLRSLFEQDYPEFQVLLAVSSLSDPAAKIAREVIEEYPKTPSQLIVAGEAPTPNRKVQSLRAMTAEARYEILLMADSDVRAGNDLLRAVSADFARPEVALVTCPYRAAAGPSVWTILEAIGINTEFLAQVLTARLLSGMDFALGPTLAIRKQALEAIGGWDELGQYLAEDFVMGNRVAKMGGQIVFSRFIIEHRLGAQTFAANLAHRLRWARSTRRSRPRGYLGQIFTNPLPLALLLVSAAPKWWPLLVLTCAIRAWLAWATSQKVLRDPLTRDLWYFVPVQDLISFFVWIGGFAGSSIEWRGRKIRVLRDGRFGLAD